jgi:hypothetical protein
MLGVGMRVAKPLCENWCAVKSKIPAGRAIMPMTKAAAMIHHVRLRENSPEDVPDIQPLYGNGEGGKAGPYGPV